jgi:hypothetical protein
MSGGIWWLSAASKEFSTSSLTATKMALEGFVNPAISLFL